ncbi:MAG TPA: SRPBCC family protein [Solirubrobacteraceae bacterium]|jgi:uncharacterized protein YndB with AHSA1/START domain
MYGNLEQLDDGRWQLRFTRALEHPPEKVWRAITEPEHLARWFPTTIDGDRTQGAKLTFRFPADQFGPFDGEMLAYEPESVMEFQWGPDTVRLELRPAGDGTELTLLDTLEDRGKGARDGAGWHTCLDALERELTGDDAARDEMGRWKDVHEHYIASFGPEAATIGPPEGI